MQVDYLSEVTLSGQTKMAVSSKCDVPTFMTNLQSSHAKQIHSIASQAINQLTQE